MLSDSLFVITKLWYHTTFFGVTGVILKVQATLALHPNYVHTNFRFATVDNEPLEIWQMSTNVLLLQENI